MSWELYERDLSRPKTLRSFAALREVFKSPRHRVAELLSL